MSIWSTPGGDPGEPGHDQPVKLAQAAGEWAAVHHPAGPDAGPEPAWYNLSGPVEDEPGLEEEDEPEPEEYDPGPEVDDEGGMSEYRHHAGWQDVDRAEYEREAGT